MIKKRLLKYERKDHGGAIIWVNTMDIILNQISHPTKKKQIITRSNSLEGEVSD